MDLFDEGYHEQTEFVPSEKLNGFLVCVKCKSITVAPWSKDFPKWRFCPVCGRSIKKGEKNA